MANLAGVLKFFAKSSETFEDNLSSSIAAGATIVPVNSATEYSDGDVVCLTVDPGTADEATFIGEKNGSQFENCIWTEGNTGVGHASGATIVDYVSATHFSAMSEGIQKEHNQDGTHKHVHADALTVDSVPITQLLPPTGAMLPFGGGSAPTGWLLCDGSAVDRTAYAELFSAIGTAYGVGDGTTTFNLPNAKGRTIVGKDAAQTEFDALGEAGGAKTHTLTTAEMPSHAHGISGIYIQNNVNYSGSGLNPLTNDPRSGTINSTNLAGGGGAHNNLQPYLVANYIIKT